MLLGIVIGVLGTVFAGAAFSEKVRAIATEAWAKITKK